MTTIENILTTPVANVPFADPPLYTRQNVLNLFDALGDELLDVLEDMGFDAESQNEVVNRLNKVIGRRFADDGIAFIKRDITVDVEMSFTIQLVVRDVKIEDGEDDAYTLGSAIDEQYDINESSVESVLARLSPHAIYVTLDDCVVR